MSSAAAKASKTMGRFKRNRPSHFMSKKESEGTPETVQNPMDYVNSQYLSLSERLSLENAASDAATLTAGKKQKVRWAETAKLASTLDAAKANDEEQVTTSPLEVISELFSKKYTLPVFLMVATSIFLVVHLSARGDGNSLYTSKAELNHKFPTDSSQESFSTLQKSRSFNTGESDGFSSVIFSFVPTPSVSTVETQIPTSEVMLHVTPKIRAGIPSPAEAGKDGYEPGWVLVPSSAYGERDEYQGGYAGIKEGWGYPPRVPTPDPALLLSEGGYYHGGGNFDGDPLDGLFNVETAPDKWDVPQGMPTPDPIYLSDVSPVTQKWNFPDGVPTPDPIYLPKGPSTELGKGTWGYPPGVPTPNPDLMVEVAASPDDSSPTTLKWNIPLGQPTPDPALLHQIDDSSPTTLKWNIPLGQPTPDPALLSQIDDTSPTTLKWKIPLGEPTPDPAQLGSPVTLGWNYPPGVPTPDPALLAGVPDTLDWGYPPGVPTPDPAFLEGNKVTMTWGYPPGVPTPDPGLLSGDSPMPTTLTKSGESPMPTSRNVETGKTDVTVKKPDIILPSEPAQTSSPKDSEIEVAPPAPIPSIPITVKNPNLPIPPSPQVNTQPYSGHYGWFRPQGTGLRPARPSDPRPVSVRNPSGYFPQGGYIMGGCGGCCGGCCGCGGGMMMGGMMGSVPVADGSNALMVPQYNPGGGSVDTRFNLPGLSLPGLPEPQCPWSCTIDETVPTKGQSNEDDAIYEIFYTNPLHCCGTIVEIGAGNGEDNSPSYFFEHGMNWTSILTEADPTNFDLMTKKRTGEKAALLNGAFCQEGSHIYYDEKSSLFQTETPGQYSSEAMKSSGVIKDKSNKVDCIRLDSDVLSGIDHVDVMVIRVKGDPWSVVRTMDWGVTVDIWVILMEDKPGMLHDTLRAALKLHDYVPAAWEIKLWCETPSNCMQNEVWLRKSFSALPEPLMEMNDNSRTSLRGSYR